MAADLAAASGKEGPVGWTSSALHEATRYAKSDEEAVELFNQWAKDYDEEVNSHNYQALESVTSTAFRQLEPARGACPGSVLRVLDAGCGTGLLAERMLKENADAGRPFDLQIAGGDFSLEMLRIAERTGRYTELQEVNLKKPLPWAQNSFDLIVAAGAFGLGGHCGPECLQPMLASLRLGCHAVFTVNRIMFEADSATFHREAEAAGCVLLSWELMPYFGEAEANVIVIQKRLPLT